MRPLVLHLLLELVLVILELQDLIGLFAQLHLQSVDLFSAGGIACLLVELGDGAEGAGAALQTLALESIHELLGLHFGVFCLHLVKLGLKLLDLFQVFVLEFLGEVLLLCLLLVHTLRILRKLIYLRLQLSYMFLLPLALLEQSLRFLRLVDQLPGALVRRLLLVLLQLLDPISQHLLLVLHGLHDRQVLVLLVLLRQRPKLANMVVIKHAVSFLPLRHQHDLILQKVLREDQVQELNECLPIIDKVLLALMHLDKLVLHFLELLLGSLELLGLLFE